MTNWIIIDKGLPDPTYEPGGFSTRNRMIKCPDCGYQFVQQVVAGCFGASYMPNFCKKCNYPWGDKIDKSAKNV